MATQIKKLFSLEEFTAFVVGLGNDVDAVPSTIHVIPSSAQERERERERNVPSHIAFAAQQLTAALTGGFCSNVSHLAAS